MQRIDLECPRYVMKSLCFIAPFEYVISEKSLQVLRYSVSEKKSTFHTLQLGKLLVGFC